MDSGSELDTIRSVEVYRFRIPFRSPVALGGASRTHREGGLIRIHIDDAEGIGEIAPLPAANSDELKQALAEAEELARGAPRPWRGAVDLLRSPSARFGMDSAIRMSLARKAGSPFLIPIEEMHASALEGAALVSGSDTVGDKLQGFQAVKVKVGHVSPEEAWRLIERLRNRPGPVVVVRADANRNWSPAEAARFFDIQGKGLDFIEEPTTQLTDDLVQRATSTRIGLDETVQELVRDGFDDGVALIDEIRARYGCDVVVVLKPSQLGSWLFTLDAVSRAREFGMRVVLSSAYETGLGMLALVSLATLSGVEEAVGFDTYGRLTDDLLVPQLPPLRGRIAVEAVVRLPQRVRLEMAERLV